MTNKEEEQQQAAELEALAAHQAETDEHEFIPKDEPQEKSQTNRMSSADAMTSLLVMGFGLISKIRGQHWAHPLDVLEESGQEFGRCIDHYSGGKELPPWLGAGLAATVLVGGPLMAEKAIADAKAQAEQNGTAKDKVVADAD